MKGTKLTTSSIYTTLSNGLAERIIRTLLDKFRIMVRHAALSEEIEGGDLSHVESLHNRTAIPLLNVKTPVEVLLGKIPNNSKLGTYGCAAYVRRHEEHRKGKFVDHSEKAIYMGHEHGFYSTYIPRTRTALDTKIVTIDEQHYSFVCNEQEDKCSH